MPTADDTEARDLSAARAQNPSVRSLAGVASHATGMRQLGISIVGIVFGLASSATAFGICTGDWNGDGHVTIDELVLGVRRVLTGKPEATRDAGVQDVDDLVAAVRYALASCIELTLCEEGRISHAADPEVKETVSGVNGTFSDRCDADGNLVERWCGVRVECVRDPINYRCTGTLTGTVQSSIRPCVQCVEGTCRARCPDFDDTLRYLAIAGEAAVFENEADGRRYECVLFRDPSGASGCTRLPMVGDREQVAERGLQVVDGYCTGHELGYIKLTNRCTYHCAIAPLEE